MIKCENNDNNINKELILEEFYSLERKSKISKKNIITEIQKNNATNIYKTFDNPNNIVTLAISPCQSGKTGIILYFVKLLIMNLNIDYNDILILTGYSSCDWVSQTQDRFPEGIRNNIFHRDNIKNFEEKLKNSKNMFIIIDEVHIGTNIKNQIGIFFKEILDYNKLINRNIKFLEISATPDDILIDLNYLKEENRRIFICEIPKEYVGFSKLNQRGQIFEYNDLINIDNIIEIKKHIDYYNDNLYHIIRISTKEVLAKQINENIDKIFNNNNYIIQEYNEKSQYDPIKKRQKDINELYLNNKPLKPTIILIKEKLRCSITINKNYIGILYERKPEKPNHSTIIQGLLGRACGYHNNYNIKIFTSLKSIEYYEELIRNNYNNDNNKKSKKSKKTINNPDVIYRNNDNNDSKKDDNKSNIIYKIQLTKEEFNDIHYNDKKYDKNKFKYILKNINNNCYNYLYENNYRINNYCSDNQKVGIIINNYYQENKYISATQIGYTYKFTNNDNDNILLTFDKYNYIMFVILYEKKYIKEYLNDNKSYNIKLTEKDFYKIYKGIKNYNKIILDDLLLNEYEIIYNISSKYSYNNKLYDEYSNKELHKHKEYKNCIRFLFNNNNCSIYIIAN